MRNRAILAALALLAACGGGPSAETKKSEARKVEKPKPPAVYKVRFETTKGPFVIEVQRDWAPRGADHFFELVNERFYDGVRFHRVMRRFIAQFGINGDPETQRLWSSLRLPDDPRKERNRKGTITYAKLGPASRSTQVFINLADNASLDADGFAPFGKVIEGMDIVEKLAFVYGEVQPKGGGPDPTQIELRGNSYLDSQYPRLDAIKTARIID